MQLDFFELLDWPELPSSNDFAWERPDPMRDDRAYWFSACHEAGHAVANACAGRPPLGMWIQRTGLHSGMTWNDPTPLPPAQSAVSHLAGMAAECAYRNVGPWPGGRTDIFRVRALAAEIVGPSDIDALARTAWAAACAFVRDDNVASALHAVAVALARHGGLNRADLMLVLAPYRASLPSLPFAAWPNPASPQPLRTMSRSWHWPGSMLALRLTALGVLLIGLALCLVFG